MPIPSQVVQCYKYIDARQEDFIQELRQLITVPNISSNPQAHSHVNTAIKWTQARLFRMGFTIDMKDVGSYTPNGQTNVKKIPTVILATLGNDRWKRTLLYYCHLDVFKVKLDKWEADPFTLRENDGKLYGRGTAKMKGPLLCFLHAVDTYQALGFDLPINIKIICESMNECNGIGITELLPGLKTSFLSNVDCVLMTDGQWTGPTNACILYAFRGVCCFNLTIEGLAEGLHGGEYGGVVAEPLQDLIYILNHLVDSRGTLVIPGFDNDVMQVTPDEEKIYSELRINMEEYGKVSGIKGFVYGTDHSRTLMHAWRYPSFNLHYINTFPPCNCPVNLNIPNKICARFSIRIVPYQTPARVCTLISNHLNTVLRERNSPNKVKLQMVESLHPWMEDHRHWNYQAARTASKQVYKDQANLIREGNACSTVLEFQQIMPKTNILVLPLANSEANIHKEEESISFRCYMEGTKLLTSYLYNLGISDKK